MNLCPNRRYIIDKNSVSCGVDIRFYSPQTASYVLTTSVIIPIALVIALGCLIYTTTRQKEESQTFAPLFNDKQLLKVGVLVCFTAGNISIIIESIVNWFDFQERG